MLTPSLLETWGVSVPPEWTERLQRFEPDHWIVWNPIIERFAIVRPGAHDQFVEFGGYGYPGWAYVMTIETPTEQFRPFDDAALSELMDRVGTAKRCPKRWQKQHLVRKRMKEARDWRRDDDRRIVDECVGEALEECIGPALKGRRVLGPGARGRDPYREDQ